MTAAPTPGAQELAGLIGHLYHEGNRALEREDPREAIVWYAQCLSAVQQAGDNEEFIAAVLFEVGRARALLRDVLQAAACLEASANLQKRLGRGEPEADCCQVAGDLVAALGDTRTARRLLEEAVARYRALDLRTKTTKCQRAIKRLGPPDEETEGPVVRHEFMVHVGGKGLHKLEITPAGESRWLGPEEFTPAEFDTPLVMGRMLPWDVTCTNR